MRRNDSAAINPKVLTWAIDRSGIPREEIAASVNVKLTILEAWESGLSPQFNKAIEVANILRIPFGYLFLSEPPGDASPIPDLRTPPGKPKMPMSSEFKGVLFQALAQRDWYRSYLVDIGRGKELRFVGAYSRDSDPMEIAESIRQTLGVNNDLRREAGNWANYLTKLSQRVEAAGILVMRRGVVGSTRRRLDAREFQGFAVSDKIAPMVFVNGQDFPRAKIFTLIHECAHIWTGTSAISAVDETSAAITADIETLCNSVAAEVLVPASEFERNWIPEDDFEQVEDLAKYFLVSTIVIIRRARELGKISFQTFLDMLDTSRDRIKKSDPNQKGRGNFYPTLDARNSPTFVEALISDIRRDGTLYRDAARLLSMRVPTVARMVEGVDSA